MRNAKFGNKKVKFLRLLPKIINYKNHSKMMIECQY